MNSLLILVKEPGAPAAEIPLVFKSGELSQMAEWIAECFEDADTFWHHVASDQSAVIASQKVKLREATETIQWLTEWREKVREKLGPAFREAALA